MHTHQEKKSLKKILKKQKKKGLGDVGSYITIKREMMGQAMQGEFFWTISQQFLQLDTYFVTITLGIVPSTNPKP